MKVLCTPSLKKKKTSKRIFYHGICVVSFSKKKMLPVYAAAFGVQPNNISLLVFFSFACLCYVGRLLCLWAAWVNVWLFKLLGISVTRAHFFHCSWLWYCGCAMVVSFLFLCVFFCCCCWIIVVIIIFCMVCFGAHTKFNICTIVICLLSVYSFGFCYPGKSRALWYNNTGGKHTCRNISITFVHFIFIFFFILLIKIE